MTLVTFLTLAVLIVFFNSSPIACISIQNALPSKHDDIINESYEQCKASNEVCSSNNDCCSTCCTSFTYSAMTCQDTCPNTHNVQHKEDRTHGNVVWKSKQSEDELALVEAKARKPEDRDKVISRQHRENKNETRTSSRLMSDEIGAKAKALGSDKNNGDKKPILALGEFIVAKKETKANKDIGIRINDDSGNYSSEIVAKARENVEVGLSVIDINKEKEDDDSGENENTDIGTPIIKIGEKPKDDESAENQNTDIGTPIIKISEKALKENQGKKTKELNDNVKHAHSKEGSNRDLGGDVITIQTIKNSIKVDSNKTSLQQRNVTSEEPEILNNGTMTHKKPKPNKEKPPPKNKKNSMSTSCGGGENTCEQRQSLADDIKDILTQKLPNLMSLNPTLQTATSKKPVCKATGSTCKHPAQCCSQCCAVSDGVFKCFDKGTDECQSSLPGATDPKCKKPGDHCETHAECCLNKCTDCGHFSACDNATGTICRTEGKSVVDTKLCKHLGDICGEASECCTQCCAVSAGVFKCFEEGTHECQPGDNVSNTTISEFVEVVGFAN